MECNASIVGGSLSRGPTMRALDIRSGLSMKGTLELAEDVLHGPLDIRPSHRGGLGRLSTPRGQNPLPLRNEAGPRLLCGLSAGGLPPPPKFPPQAPGPPPRQGEGLPPVPPPRVF